MYFVIVLRILYFKKLRKFQISEKNLIAKRLVAVDSGGWGGVTPMHPPFQLHHPQLQSL